MSSPGLRRAGAGRRRCVDCALGAGRAAVSFASAVGGGHEETAAVGVGADVAGDEAEASADAAHVSWWKCASDLIATSRGAVMSKCVAYDAGCKRS
eukprot:2144542-Pleurochrysis_carterae.AAC.2